MGEQLFSASSLSTFLRCGQQWEFAYVYAIKRPPNIRMVVGVAAHEAVETNFNQKLISRLDLPVGDVTDAFASAFDRLSVEAAKDPEEPAGKAKDSGVALVGTYQTQVAPTIMPLLVEQEVQFNIDGVPYSGFVDLVDEEGMVRDLKTTGRKPTDRSKYALAMTGYSVGYRALTGNREKGVLLDYMVRTKEPYYYPVMSGPASNAAIKGFSQILNRVSSSVKAGIFLPTGLGTGACSWCPYTDICPAFKSVVGKPPKANG